MNHTVYSDLELKDPQDNSWHISFKLPQLMSGKTPFKGTTIFLQILRVAYGRLGKT